ncbi:MAG: two-component sensor histidine kinase [Tannerellaceae bacterium]|jgi:two-component system OmpR family sensor kinase/two-component system phosphate regulon sensor histidine kinase PhoR|nr:two-component sensor histidine kinase [Tannerellaceae bacterium]
MKVSYRQRIFYGILMLFLLFTAGIIMIEQQQEKRYRMSEAVSRLDGYAEIVHSYVGNTALSLDSIDRMHELGAVLPDSIRLTIIDARGRVRFDNAADSADLAGNHLDRPEVRAAGELRRGHSVRRSASTGLEYLYYVRRFDNCFVRVALPYNSQTRSMLRPDNLFIYLTVALFMVVVLLVNYMARRFGSSVKQLKELATAIKKGKSIPSVSFPEDELGDIGNELVEIFKQGEQNRQYIQQEREKLIRHFRFSGEGLCIFSPEKKKIYANTGFIQYVNLISDIPILDVEKIFDDQMFGPVADFINAGSREEQYADFRIAKNAKVFSVQAVVFNDYSFEIIIKDISLAEKTKQLKQEMTGNIAHELRTPVTTLRGYLETLSNHRLPADKQQQFIERAFLQTLRLSNLIEDTSIISKIEDAPSHFRLEEIILPQLIEEVRADLRDKLEASSISFTVSMDEALKVKGNYTLLYAVFRNLIDNSISYAGPDISVSITNYSESEHHYYFSYYDTGSGVEEKHLGRLFERFYRVSEGRTRDTGGSGLGLSIVKNAILFHKGDIQVKNRPGGGLEFLFTLRK